MAITPVRPTGRAGEFLARMMANRRSSYRIGGECGLRYLPPETQWLFIGVTWLTPSGQPACLTDFSRAPSRQLPLIGRQ